MGYSIRQIRVILLALAIASACSAVFVQHWRVLPFAQNYVTTGAFKCSLLPETVSIYDVQATVGSLEYQGAVGAKVAVEEITGDPRALTLAVRHSEQEQAEDAFQQAVSLLELKLKSLAVSEVEASRAYVDELRTEVRERSQTRPQSSGAPEPTLAALSSEEEARVRLIKQESTQIRAFLGGGAKPTWLAARIDRMALENAERKVQREKEALLRLTATFSAQNRAVQAQSQQLEKARADLLALQKHLAKTILAAHTAELERLEDKALAIVKANAERTQKTAEKPEVEPDLDEPSEATNWLREHSHKLDERVRELEKRASLSEISGPVTTLEQPSGYWTVTGLWGIALVSLLAALFLPARRGFVAAASQTAEPPRPNFKAAPLRGEPSLALPSVSLEPPTNTAETESFFQNFQHQMEKQLGRSPSCILVLGSSKGPSRSSLSLRLAKNFSNSRQSVKLVDFDLQERPLSQRIGDESSPGVTDLLTHAGPVEEFFASVPGTAIQFAPAGTYRAVGDLVCQETLKTLLRRPPNGITLVDASFASPLHLLLGEIDVVLCLTRPGIRWSEQEQQVLLAFREAGMPVWGIAHGDSQIYPFI